jgi:uncharacterized damage-inducible protein DinB
MLFVMPVSADTLRHHLAYSAWADDRLLRAVEQVPADHLNHDFGTADRTILRTLVHVYAADRIWFGRILGAAPKTFVSDADYQLSVLKQDWPALNARWQDWAAGIEDSGAVIHYQDLKGNPWQSPVWQIVLHVVNHATSHRGQVAGFLRALGHTPPPLDLIVFYRE